MHPSGLIPELEDFLSSQKSEQINAIHIGQVLLAVAVFTHSFISTECVSADKCTTGQTILVVILTILYWAVLVV